jgi:large conductance mechanosensitive channel
MKETRQLLSEFKKFLLRGNVVDLAVAVVIGASFTNVVNAMVKDIITPIIAAIGGKPDFSALKFTIHGSAFLYGDLLNSILSFLIVATVVFFFVVQPINHLVRLANRGEIKQADKDPQVKVLEEIRDLLQRSERSPKR